MIPLSRLHKHKAVPIWYLSIFAFFIGAIYFIKKILTINGGPRPLSKTFYFLGILLSLRFLLSVVQRVQSDCLVLFLLSLFILALFYKKDAWAGFSLAAAAMVKLTPLIFIPYLLLRKRFKAVLSCGLFSAVFLFIPALYVGWMRNLQYLNNWFLVHRKNPAEYLLWYKNQSLLSALLRLFGKDSPAGFILFIVLALALFWAIFLFTRKARKNFSNFSYLTEISLVLILMIVLSPLAWKHTFVHLLIPHLVLLYYVLYINPQDKIIKGLLIASFFLNTVLNPELTKPVAQLIQQYSNVTWGALILYAALLRCLYVQDS
jgi:hypothetical protein